MLPAMVEALFIIDAPETFDPKADSTYVMVQEAQRRGHATHGATLADLHLLHADAHAHTRPLVFDGERLRFDGELGAARPLASFDVVLMRKDPPLDEQYLTATWMLDRAGTLVINHPRGLRDHNEKLSMLSFRDITPETRILRRITDLHATLKEFGGRMIVKPVFGFGGREVLQARTGDPNLSTLFELATRDETRWTVAQALIETAKEGDKRILLLDGEPMGAVLRVGAPGELRDNFHAGGVARATEITDRDLEICAAVGPLLREHGQYFSGIDVIGGLLTEINVTSPTGMQEINRLNGLDGDQTMQARFWDGIDDKLRARA
jgi:glutathione synthase